MKTHITAWILVILALATWAGFFYFAYTISAERALFMAEKGEAQTMEEESRMQSRVRSLLRDTQKERTALETFTTVDIVTAAGLIEQAGKVAGVKAEIEGATAAPPIDPLIDVRSVLVSVSVQGTFTGVREFVSLIEQAPFASFIESVDMRPSEAGTPNRWEGSLRIKIITTSTLGV
jgi:hypothetical protein